MDHTPQNEKHFTVNVMENRFDLIYLKKSRWHFSSKKIFLQSFSKMILSDNLLCTSTWIQKLSSMEVSAQRLFQINICFPDRIACQWLVNRYIFEVQEPFGTKHNYSKQASKNDKQSYRLTDMVLMYSQILGDDFESKVFCLLFCSKQRCLFKLLCLVDCKKFLKGNR